LNTTLYIVWNEKQSVLVPIVDEQHHAIVAAINSLYFFINQGWGLNALSPTLKIIKTCVGFHIKTEEGILEKLGADYKTLAKHAEIYNNFDVAAEHATKQSLIEQDPMILLKFLRDWWVNHRTKDHLEYEKYLSSIMERDLYK
jgi:hemerythrin-like metal-binding protein